MSGTIIYTCPFVPAEWIAAHGMTPSRIMPHSTRTVSPVGMAEGVCPYARAFMNAAILEADAAAVVVTTVCDQMRRASEIIARNCDLPVFLMNVPATWETSSAQRLYVSELERLGRFMTELGREPPSAERLSEIMREYEAMRSRIRDARGHISPRRHSELIASFHRSGKVDPKAPGTAYKPSGVSLALVGGPMLSEHFQIFDLIENAGGYVALDATETGERTMPVPFDMRRLAEDPLSVLADAYFGSIPDASRRPNSMLYRWLKSMTVERDIRGVILLRYVWCDTWHAEAQRMKEWLGLPFFDLDIADEVSDMSLRLTQLQAFMEMLG